MTLVEEDTDVQGNTDVNGEHIRLVLQEVTREHASPPKPPGE